MRLETGFRARRNTRPSQLFSSVTGDSGLTDIVEASINANSKKVH